MPKRKYGERDEVPQLPSHCGPAHNRKQDQPGNAINVYAPPAHPPGNVAKPENPGSVLNRISGKGGKAVGTERI